MHGVQGFCQGNGLVLIVGLKYKMRGGMVVFPTIVIGLLHGEFSLAKLQKTGALTTFASTSQMCHIFNKPPYYSFKIFPRF